MNISELVANASEPADMMGIFNFRAGAVHALYHRFGIVMMAQKRRQFNGDWRRRLTVRGEESAMVDDRRGNMNRFRLLTRRATTQRACREMAISIILLLLRRQRQARAASH